MKILKVLAFAGALLGFGLANAWANPVGTLNLANCGGGGVTVTATTITWLPAGTVAGTGCVTTGAGTSVSFFGGSLGSGVNGNIKNLTAGGGVVDDFMTFPAMSPTLDFQLFALGPGSSNTNCGSLAIGQSCSVVAGSPFILTNLGGGDTSVSLSAGGQVLDSQGASSWSGAYTTQLTLDPATIQNEIKNGQSITSTQSGQFTITIPEPGTLSMLMLGAGLVGLGLKRRKA